MWSNSTRSPTRTESKARSGRVVSVSYLGLTREAPVVEGWDAAWQPWYRFFPWEDFRGPGAALGESVLAPALYDWAESANDPLILRDRRQRITINFGLLGHRWNEELVLQRYELLWEAGLVAEGRASDAGLPETLTEALGEPMRHDHRRILATGLARLRAKIKYRPVVFELMPPSFHAAAAAANGGGAGGAAAAQAEFPAADRPAGPG